jgi:uncharacterized protein
MDEAHPTFCTAFLGSRLLASGALTSVALKAKAALEQDETAPLLIFDDDNGRIVDVDFRGSPEDVVRRIKETEVINASREHSETAPRGPGRPKLGVIGREVTLLPRHWEWLNSQPGGASVAIRKLVEEARRVNATKDRSRKAQDAVYRFMSAMAGNEEGFEEASRALFSANQKRFDDIVENWPDDVGAHAKQLAALAFREL